MTSLISIYCSGGIKKGPHDDRKLTWDERAHEEFRTALRPYQVVFLNPDERTDDVSDLFTVFGRDHYQVSVADFVVIDARQRRGIGVGIEMLSAKWFTKPVISIVPRNSHYRREELQWQETTIKNYIHPHLLGLSDAVVSNFAEAAQWIREFLANPRPVKDMSVLTAAIDTYKQKQLKRDDPMVEALRMLVGSNTR